MVRRATTDSLLRSRDYGRTFEDARLPGPGSTSTVWCIAANPADPMLLFVCTNLGELFVARMARDLDAIAARVRKSLRALHWRPLPQGMRKAAHAITRPVLKAAQNGLGRRMTARAATDIAARARRPDGPKQHTTMEGELLAWLAGRLDGHDGQIRAGRAC